MVDTPKIGVARLDGLLEISWSPDPGVEPAVDAALDRLTGMYPVRLNLQRDPGAIALMPEQELFRFDSGARPSQILLPIIRDLIATVSPRGEATVESTLRIQEYLGDEVLEGVFVHEEEMGMTLTARERPIRPEERPEMPEPTLSDRTENLLRRHQWTLLLGGVVLLVIGYVGWQAGWWGLGMSSVKAPAVEYGPLEQIVLIEKVRVLRDTLVLDLRPGADFAKFGEAAAGADLYPGIFRLLLREEGKVVGPILPLDLTDLPERVAELEDDETVRVEIPYKGPRFEELVICR